MDLSESVLSACVPMTDASSEIERRLKSDEITVLFIHYETPPLPCLPITQGSARGGRMYDGSDMDRG